MKRKNVSIKDRILVFVIIFLIACTGMVSLISGFNLYARSSEEVKNSVSQKNIILTQTINGTFARYQSCVDEAAQFIHANPKLTGEDCERFFNLLINSPYVNGEYYDAFIGYTDGTAIHGTGWIPPYPQWQSYNRAWWKVAEESPGMPVFCEPYLDMDTGELGVSVSMTVHPENVSEGVVGIDLPLSDLVDFVKESNEDPLVQSFIVNSSGDILIHPDTDLAPFEDGTLQNLTQVKGGKYAKLWQQIVSGERIITTSIVGDPKEIYITDTLDNGWHVISKISFHAIMSPVNQMIITNIIVFLIVLGVCVVAISILVTRIVISPLETITDVALKLSDGYVNMQVDETYVGELGKLSMSFNRIIENTLVNKVVTERMADGDYTAKVQIRSEGDVFGISLDKLNKRLDDMQTQIAIQIQEYELLGRTDPLTGIPNRRDFDEHMQLEWKRAMRNKTTISFLMLDIDKFKVYNDTYGHPQGDKLLKAVANIIFETARRPSDVAARLGGEEFALLLPETELSKALIVAENIRAKVEALRVPDETGADTAVTVSIGATSLMPDANDIIENVISAADKNLYNAKESGRNRIYSDETGN
ncbi:hypothetical protein FACS1894111_09680 [Clostridia bacterium]|nr:hypothetical protein FACS1894111_09680 [Clostridia bacterium]